MRKVFLAISLITISILFRTLWHLAPNVEFLTTASLLASFYLGKKYAFIVPFAAIVISDIFIGNSSIYLFTWSAFLMIGILAILTEKIRGAKKFKGLKKLGLGLSYGIVSSFWFYVWTNFGVWYLDSWGMYPKTLAGLIQSYIMGIPFLKLNLAGNLAFIPLSLFISEKVKLCRFAPKSMIALLLNKVSRIIE